MKILILEDEQIIAQRLERLIKEILKDDPVSIVKSNSLVQASAFLSQNTIDLLFLDLNLSGENGFQILEQMAGENFQTIIVSANDDRAIEAFEYGVLDFVPKPFGKERLEKAIDKFLNIDVQKASSTKYVVIKKKGRILSIALDGILYIKGASTYSELFLKNGKKELHSKSLNGLINILPSNYERIHKSYLVDMHLVKEIVVKTGGKYSLTLIDGTKIPLGRSRYEEIKQKWFSDNATST